MNMNMSIMHFTKSEIRVILFLLAVLLCGFAVKYYHYLSDDSLPYDYSKSDEEFRLKSLNLNNANRSFDSSAMEGDFKEDSPGEINNILPEIDINKASKEELISLPGIGESIAVRIIEYREKFGKFRKPEDVMKVGGIGKKKFEAIRGHIKVQN